MKIEYRGIEIRSEYYGYKSWPLDGTNTNYHKIFIRNPKTKKHTFFEFWASNLHPKVDDEHSLMEALECFLTDANAGSMEFEEFCGEFGYAVYKEDGYPNANAKRIWKNCKISKEKFDRVFEGMDLCEVHNEVLDMLD